MLFDDILGHEAIKRGLMHALRKDRVHHALLFMGRSGIGKAMLARAFVQVNFCERSRPADKEWARCKECRHCRRVAEGQHPDFLELKTETASISIDRIRELQQSVAYQPYEASRRMVIIHDAHLMQIAAANALLKTLEEPTTRTSFILITDQEQRLLPTIISRCQILRFAPFSQVEVQEFLTQRGCAREKAQAIAALSLGSLSDAIELSEGSHSERILERFDDITNLSHALDCFALADTISKDKEIHSQLLLLLTAYLRDLLILQNDENATLSLEHQRQSLLKRARHTESSHIHRCMLLCDEIHAALLGNANALLSFERLFLGLRHVFF
ncbi:MAG: DNA polymerase III subunit delta' [Bradymonadales bacterium]